MNVINMSFEFMLRHLYHISSFPIRREKLELSHLLMHYCVPSSTMNSSFQLRSVFTNYMLSVRNVFHPVLKLS